MNLLKQLNKNIRQTTVTLDEKIRSFYKTEYIINENDFFPDFLVMTTLPFAFFIKEPINKLTLLSLSLYSLIPKPTKTKNYYSYDNKINRFIRLSTMGAGLGFAASSAVNLINYLFDKNPNYLHSALKYFQQAVPFLSISSSLYIKDIYAKRFYDK